MELEFIRDITKETIPCPFCANEENKYRSLMTIHLGGSVHYVKCESCAACGPITAQYPDPESAIEAWNKRPKLPRTKFVPGRKGIGDEIINLYPTFTPQQIALKLKVPVSTIYYHLNKKYGNLKAYTDRLNPERKATPWRDKLQKRNRDKRGEIEQINQLRAEGKTWKEVSRALGRSVSYCQGWAARGKYRETKNTPEGQR